MLGVNVLCHVLLFVMLNAIKMSVFMLNAVVVNVFLLIVVMLIADCRYTECHGALSIFPQNKCWKIGLNAVCQYA
jgi:hypothetical protein